MAEGSVLSTGHKRSIVCQDHLSHSLQSHSKWRVLSWFCAQRRAGFVLYQLPIFDPRRGLVLNSDERTVTVTSVGPHQSIWQKVKKNIKKSGSIHPYYIPRPLVGMPNRKGKLLGEVPPNKGKEGIWWNLGSQTIGQMIVDLPKDSFTFFNLFNRFTISALCLSLNFMIPIYASWYPTITCQDVLCFSLCKIPPNCSLSRDSIWIAISAIWLFPTHIPKWGEGKICSRFRGGVDVEVLTFPDVVETQPHLEMLFGVQCASDRTTDPPK